MVNKIQFRRPEEQEQPEQQEVTKGSGEYTFAQVPTQYAPAVQTPEGEVISQEQLIIEMANKLEIIYQAIVGKR